MKDKGFRIEIPVQSVAEAFFQIGAICLGGVFAFGKEPDRTEVRRFIPNVRTEITDAGTIYADERGPIAREETWSWTDGLNLYDIRHGPTSNYRAASGSTAKLVGDHDVTDQLVGAMVHTRSGEGLVCALRDIPETAITQTDRRDFLYGRLLTPVQATGIGDDHERTDSATFQEEV